jgi:hypothetical protein
MRNMKFNLWNFVFIMVLLYVGGLLGGYILPMVPMATGWLGSILLGMIQIALISIVGMASGKLSLWTIVLGGVVVFVGGILGGFVSDFIGMTGLYATIVTLAVQTAVLMMMGFVKGSGKFGK